VELIGIINKSLLFHLLGCLYYCVSDSRSYKHRICCIDFVSYLSRFLLLCSGYPCLLFCVFLVNMLKFQFTTVAQSLTAFVSLENNRVQFTQVKGKVSPVHTMRAYLGSRGIASLILNFGFRRRWVNWQPHAPSTSPLGEEPPVPVE